MVPQNGAMCPKSADVTAKKQYTNNLLLTQHFRMGLDGYKHKRNLNVLVVGGSRGRKEPDLCDSEHHAVQLLDGDHRSESGTSAQNRRCSGTEWI